jgi:hypothetical protein
VTWRCDEDRVVNGDKRDGEINQRGDKIRMIDKF